MDWHFYHNGESTGPVDGIGLLQLRADATINDDTLIFCQGMSDWSPLRLNRDRVVAFEKETNPDLEECAFSGTLHSRESLLAYGDQWILPDHKDSFVQELAEGRGESKTSQFEEGISLAIVWRRAWKIFGAHFLTIALIHVTVWLVLDQLASLADVTIYETDDLAGIRGSFNLYRLFNSLFGIIAMAGILQVCIRSEEQREVNYGTCLVEGLRYWGKIWVTRFLGGILLFVPLFLLLIPAILISDSLEFVPLFVALGLWIILAIWFLIRAIFYTTHVVISGEWGWKPIPASFSLTKGHTWRVLWYSIVVGLLVSVIAIVAVSVTLIPGLDHWVLAGFLSTIGGIGGTFWTVFIYAFYRQLQSYKTWNTPG